jgi:hypothetical protein
MDLPLDYQQNYFIFFCQQKEAVGHFIAAVTVILSLNRRRGMPEELALSTLF